MPRVVEGVHGEKTLCCSVDNRGCVLVLLLDLGSKYQALRMCALIRNTKHTKKHTQSYRSNEEIR